MARVVGFLAHLVLVVLIAALLAPAAEAKAKSKHHPAPVSRHEDVTSIVIDAETGKVISEQGADTPNYPASLTKMMTLYLLFDALEKGRVKLDTPLTVSAYAAGQEPTKLGLRPGETVAVRDALLGLVTRSANDAAVVIAENLAGSEDAFAQRMTAKAHALGMTSTTFRNASGLPDPGQMTTARDLSKLARALYRDFPEEYKFFATEAFNFHGQHITTHNHLMTRFEGMDGIKTGYIRAAGFNLAASAVRDGHRLIGVVMGGRSAVSRDNVMAGLLTTAFVEARRDDGIAKLMQANSNVTPEPATPAAAPAQVAAAPVPAPAPVAVAAAAPAPAPVTPAPVTPAPAVPAQVASADVTVTSIADEPVAEPQPQSFAARAKRTLSHLSPVSTAEAATPSRAQRAEPMTERWSIQVGAFSQKGAAEKAASSALHAIKAGKGKSIAVLAPNGSEGERFFRARIGNFSEREAERACHLLHKKGRDCAVLSPSAVHVAAAN